MRQTLTICATILLIIVTICGTVVGVNFVNRDRPHVDSSEEVYKKECAKRGGDITSKSGIENGIKINEERCEVRE